jgi:hypothetical protein
MKLIKASYEISHIFSIKCSTSLFILFLRCSLTCHDFLTCIFTIYFSFNTLLPYTKS